MSQYGSFTPKNAIEKGMGNRQWVIVLAFNFLMIFRNFAKNIQFLSQILSFLGIF